MPRGGKTGGKLASSRSSTVYPRSSAAASSTRNQELSGSVASVLAELQSLLVQTQVRCALFGIPVCLHPISLRCRRREMVEIRLLLTYQRLMKR